MDKRPDITDIFFQFFWRTIKSCTLATKLAVVTYSQSAQYGCSSNCLSPWLMQKTLRVMLCNLIMRKVWFSRTQYSKFEPIVAMLRHRLSVGCVEIAAWTGASRVVDNSAAQSLVAPTAENSIRAHQSSCRRFPARTSSTPTTMAIRWAISKNMTRVVSSWALRRRDGDSWKPTNL